MIIIIIILIISNNTNNNENNNNDDDDDNNNIYIYTHAFQANMLVTGSSSNYPFTYI